MEEIGYDDYFFGKGVCLIEWAELIEEDCHLILFPSLLKRIWTKDLIIEKLPLQV